MNTCTHGLEFDPQEANRILGDWKPMSTAEWVAGNPRYKLVRERFPRLSGKCPLGCGFEGTAYYSMEHFVAGGW